MSIEFRSPTEDNIAMMKKFASVVDSGLEIIAKENMQHVAPVVASKLQEALMWFSHGVLNMPVYAEQKEQEQEAKPVEGELVQAA